MHCGSDHVCEPQCKAVHYMVKDVWKLFVCYLKYTVSCITVYMDMFLQVLKSALHQGFVTIQFIFQQKYVKHVTTIAE